MRTMTPVMGVSRQTTFQLKVRDHDELVGAI
jgi:hypothetical protein